MVDGGSSDAGPDPRAAELHDRADALAATMMLRYWTQLRDATNDSYWTYANDWDVILDAVDRHGAARYLGAARMFYDVQDARGWSRDFYDDENWMALALIRAYDVFKDPAYLNRAVSLYLDIESAWDETCCGAQKGGIWWRKQHDAKVTAINGGAIITGVRLYEHTQDASYLAFAKKVFAYWSTTMVDPASGHVYDNISSAGQINTTWSFTYNEGVMIGAGVALARATGDASYLAFAHKVAGYMLSHESAQGTAGTFLSDGKCGKPGGDDGEQFKGIAARYLALLYEADRSHTEYRDFLVRSSDALWASARDAQSGLVSCDWAGPYDTNTNSVNSLSSAAMTTAVTARILGPAPADAPLTWQVEEGELHAVGLEASHTGFHGFGYTAGWNADGQWVDVLVDLPQAGTFDAQLRYAAATDASRLLYVNGATLKADFAFPTTGSYDAYGTVGTTLSLPAGRSTVSIIYNGGQGSHGYLNLDEIVLTKKP